jgi:hypothetical protein
VFLMEIPGDRPLLRIGELSRRLRAGDHVLRAWSSSPPPSRRPSSRSARSSPPSLALALAGPTPQIATAMGARLMAGDPVTEAGRAGWSR